MMYHCVGRSAISIDRLVRLAGLMQVAATFGRQRTRRFLLPFTLRTLPGRLSVPVEKMTLYAVSFHLIRIRCA